MLYSLHRSLENGRCDESRNESCIYLHISGDRLDMSNVRQVADKDVSLMDQSGQRSTMADEFKLFCSKDGQCQ